MHSVLLDFFAILIVIGLICVFFVIFIVFVIYHNYCIWQNQTCYRHKCSRYRDEIVAEEID